MEQVLFFRTRDGDLFETQDMANEHINKLYGNKLTYLAHRAVRIEKYVDMCNFIEKYSSEFKELLDLKEDLKLKKSLSDEEDEEDEEDEDDEIEH